MSRSEDRGAITDLIYRYAELIDAGDFEGLGLLLGKFQSEPDLLKGVGALQIEDLGPQHAQGRELARACIASISFAEPCGPRKCAA